jgi:hypothetical protein
MPPSSGIETKLGLPASRATPQALLCHPRVSGSGLGRPAFWRAGPQNARLWRREYEGGGYKPSLTTTERASNCCSA